MKSCFTDYVDLYKMRSRLSALPVEEFLHQAAREGVERMVVCGNDQDDNDHVIELSRKHEAIIPVGFIRVDNGIRHALRETERCFGQGAVAVNLAPHMVKLDVNDRSLYPIYGYCELVKKPVIVHGAIHFWRGSYMWHGQPQHIDEIAVDFPELKIIVSHGGNGFGVPILAVAQRHPNLYLEFSALNPTYMAPEFLYAANTYLKRKCTFGTDYPLVDFDVAVARWRKVLRENVQDLFFHQNIIDALYGEPVAYR